MRFWDTSALVPLLLEQKTTAEVEEYLAQDPDMAAWWGTPRTGPSFFVSATSGGRVYTY